MKGRKIKPDSESDIDWMVVDMVVYEGRSHAVTAEEMRAVMRRLQHRMVSQGEATSTMPPGKLSYLDVARRLHTTARTLHRIVAALPPATEDRCPVCGQRMFVLADGTVEQHGNAMFERCRYTRKQTGLRGLAAIRPDLFPWMEEVS